MKPPSNGYNGEGEVQTQVTQEQGEANVAMAVCVQLAGRAIIRVVSRCEEAQDNCNLGEWVRISIIRRKIILCALDVNCHGERVIRQIITEQTKKNMII